MAQSRHDLKILDISNHLLGPNLNGVQPCSILVQEEDQQYDLLLWSRMFQTPSQTLSEFSHKFEDSLKLLSDDHEVALIGRAVQVMSRWLTWFPEDFQVIMIHFKWQINL